MITVVVLILIAFMAYAWATGKRAGQIAALIVLAPVSLIPVAMLAEGAGTTVAKVTVLPVTSIILLVLASAPRLLREDKCSHYLPPTPGWANYPMTLNLPQQPGRVRTALGKLWD